jgi:hypothetical protein
MRMMPAHAATQVGREAAAVQLLGMSAAAADAAGAALEALAQMQVGGAAAQA